MAVLGILYIRIDATLKHLMIETRLGWRFACSSCKVDIEEGRNVPKVE